MRGTMHAPKPDGARRRRNSPTHAETVLVRDGEVRGPSLDEAAGPIGPAGIPWLPSVVAWWEDWRRMPQAALFEATDWRRLALLAPIVQTHTLKPSAAALGEIRMNEERLGATVVDRTRARMVIVDPEPTAVEGGNVVGIASRRDVAARLQSGADAGE